MSGGAGGGGGGASGGGDNGRGMENAAMAEWGGADGETKPSRRARGVGPQLGRRRLDVGDGARARRWRLFLFRQPPASRVCWRWGSPVGLRSCQPSFSVRPGGRAPCGRRRGRRTRVGEAGGTARRVRPSGDVVAPAFVLFCKPPSAGLRRAVRRGRSQLAVDGRRGAANWPRGCLRAPTLHQATGTCRRLRLVLVTEFPCRLGRRSHLPWG